MRIIIETHEGLSVKKFTKKDDITGKLLKSYQTIFNGDKYDSHIVLFPQENYFASSFAKDVLEWSTN